MGSHTHTGRHGLTQRIHADATSRGHGEFTPAPVLLQWMATLRCDLACPHCLAAGEGPTPPDMPLDEAIDLVDQAADLGVEELLVTGGEPLLREDLGEVIAHLGRRHLAWSLNTAAMPPAGLRPAIEANPPVFVAVSLDGPACVHDAFRGRHGSYEESRRALEYFAALPGCHVAAGTTVTRRNLPYLRETFDLVAAGKADSWGIHLLIPEGRARNRKDLDLSRHQLRRLLRFVERKRAYFPVTLADEIGYCGDREPLLRDVPWSCGAGRAQCVVLPTGHVVPCTTLDLTTAAGNLREQPLAEIWREGDWPMRTWTPEGACAACDYAPACGGGCWLQRRAGSACMKSVWRVPGLKKTAAGMAVSLGVLAGAAAAAGPTEAPAPRPPRPRAAYLIRNGANVPFDVLLGETSCELAAHIAQFYARPLPWAGIRIRPDPGNPARHVVPYKPALTDKLAADPGGQFFLAFVADKLPADLDGQCKAVRTALDTKQVSLALSALLWRTLAEACWATPPTKRTAAQRKALRELIALLAEKTLGWRAALYRGKLEPFLARGRKHMRYGFEMSKARRPTPSWLTLLRDTASERWGAALAPRRPRVPLKADEAAQRWLARNPHADHMALSVLTKEGAWDVLRLKQRATAKGKNTLGPFDMIAVGPKVAKVTVQWPAAKLTLDLALPAGAELTYADVLALAHAQHAEKLDQEVQLHVTRPFRGLQATNPLFAAAVRRRLAKKIDLPVGGPSRIDLPVGGASWTVLAWWMADFWMF